MAVVLLFMVSFSWFLYEKLQENNNAILEIQRKLTEENFKLESLQKTRSEEERKVKELEEKHKAALREEEHYRKVLKLRVEHQDEALKKLDEMKKFEKSTAQILEELQLKHAKQMEDLQVSSITCRCVVQIH